MTDQTPTIPTFGTVARDALPKRQGPKRERTPEELALRDALWAIIADGVTGAVDPTTYPARKDAVNAANRYRLLLTPNVGEGQRIETRLTTNEAGQYVVTILLGTRPAKPKTAAKAAK